MPTRPCTTPFSCCSKLNANWKREGEKERERGEEKEKAKRKERQANVKRRDDGGDANRKLGRRCANKTGVQQDKDRLERTICRYHRLF